MTSHTLAQQLLRMSDITVFITNPLITSHAELDEIINITSLEIGDKNIGIVFHSVGSKKFDDKLTESL